MKKYSREFVREAIRLTNRIGVQEASQVLGLSVSSLMDWSEHVALFLTEDEIRAEIRCMEQSRDRLREKIRLTLAECDRLMAEIEREAALDSEEC